jgi:hypothetical protein
MGFVTVKDFATALGVNGVTVRQRIVRGKLIKNEYGLIDVTEPMNYSYVVEINAGDLSVFNDYYKSDYSLANVSKKTITPTKKIEKIIVDNKTVKKEVVLVEKSEKDEIKEVNDSKGSVNLLHRTDTKKTKPIIEQPKLTLEEKRILAREKQQRLDLIDLDLRKRTAETTLVERNSELRQLQLEKIAGNTLPLDITKSILMINIQTIFTTFNSEIDNMVTITVEELGGTRADAVRIQNKLKVVFKKLIETTKDNSNREIEKVVNEYADVRSRGERK